MKTDPTDILARVVSLVLEMFAQALAMPFVFPAVVIFITFRLVRWIWNRQRSGIGYSGPPSPVGRAVRTSRGFTRTAEMALEQTAARIEAAIEEPKSPDASEAAAPEPVEWQHLTVKKPAAPTWNTYDQATPTVDPDPEPIEPWEDSSSR